MIRSGLVSISFRKLSAEQIIDLSRRASLAGIEWGGDLHVPHGDTATAHRVGRLTRQAGLEVAAYGSYYKIGESESAGLSFRSVLDSAVALGAPTVRVWAGSKSPRNADEIHWTQAIEDAQRIAELAASAEVRICFEYHKNTLTDDHKAAIELYTRINHHNVDLLWQPSIDRDFQTNLISIQAMLPYISNVHVYWWTRDHQTDEFHRHPLAEARTQWQAFIDVLRDKDLGRYALLEYVKDDSEEQLIQDAREINCVLQL